MKYVFLLATVAVVYFFLVRKAPVAPVVAEITQQEAAPPTTGPRNPPATVTPAAPAVHTNSLKRPIDRTREVLNQVKQRNGGGEF
jgi:hypothetical protein